VFDFQVSIGEIGNILEKEANNLRPEYQRLKQSIQKQSAVHYDETSWRVEKEEFGKYAWVATGIDNNEVLFMLGKSRGKGNIEELGVSQIGISDDYGAYRNTFSYHQLCFAHPHRKLRDMAESAVFKDTEKHQIEKTYKQFSNLYQKIRERPKPDVSLYMKRKFQTNFTPTEHLLLTRHNDMPGIIGRVGTLLGENSINIANTTRATIDFDGDKLLQLSVKVMF